ncbi:MFS general substrate transporter [Cadophora sp. DSE1049]|nr:MFS general substrate transporter [Cadophora sp. DSE1049]
MANNNTIPAATDQGTRAWSFMVGACMIEGLMWGLPLNFGVFQSYYQKNHIFTSSNHLPLVGTLTTAISYLGAPLMTLLTVKYPRLQHRMIWFGWALCVVSLIGSSFSTKVWHLIIMQGVLYGIGFLIIYYPLLNMLNGWFVERRGLAYGIMFASSGIFGAGLPFLLEHLLYKYGYPTTLRIYSVAICVLVGPTLPLLHSRLSDSLDFETNMRFDTSVFKKPTFLVIVLSNIPQGLVFFLPSVYLPSFASTIGLSAAQGTIVLSALNVCQIISQLSMGYASDLFNPIAPMVVSTMFSGVVVLGIWGSSNGFILLLTFGILYGLFSGGYSVLYSRFVTLLTKEADMGLWLYSMLEFQRGIGNLIGGYISSLMIGDSEAEYDNLILLIGITLLVSSLSGIGYWMFRFLACFRT